MGDRCWMWVTVRKEHLETFHTFLPRSWEDSTEESELTVTLTYEQANYGYGDELREAAEAGCEFYGHHGQGSSYENADFYTEDKTAWYIYKGTDNCGVVLNGETPEQRLDNLRGLEARLSAMSDLMERMSNPLYDLVKESA